VGGLFPLQGPTDALPTHIVSLLFFDKLTLPVPHVAKTWGRPPGKRSRRSGATCDWYHFWL